jgi:hypothetical protein
MNTPTKPTLEEAAQRNPAVSAERVRRMQEVVKQLQDRGLLKPAKYGIQPALGGQQRGYATIQALKMMNQIGDGT